MPDGVACNLANTATELKRCGLRTAYESGISYTQTDASHELPDAIAGFYSKMECKTFIYDIPLCKKVDQWVKTERRLRVALTHNIFEQEIYKFVKSYADFNYCSLTFLDVLW